MSFPNQRHHTTLHQQKLEAIQRAIQSGDWQAATAGIDYAKSKGLWPLVEHVIHRFLSKHPHSLPALLEGVDWHLLNGRCEAANHLLRSGLQLHPHKPQLLLRLGQCLVQQGDIEGGLASLQLAEEQEGATAMVAARYYVITLR